MKPELRSLSTVTRLWISHRKINSEHGATFIEYSARGCLEHYGRLLILIL